MASNATAPAIEARDLSRTFKGGIEAVRDVDLNIGAGEVFGFLGPNGAGKSTTVRMLVHAAAADRRERLGRRPRCGFRR